MRQEKQKCQELEQDIFFNRVRACGAVCGFNKGFVKKVNIMNNRNNQRDASRPLHQIFRSQIVQNYPPQSPYEDPFIHEEPQSYEINHDIFQSFVRENDIVESYHPFDDKTRTKGSVPYDNLMASESDNNDVPSRNSSLSARDNLEPINRSFELFPNQVKKFTEDMMMDIEQPSTPRKKPLFSVPSSETPRVKVEVRDRERSDKITKLQQVGCNCRKSKCLKMYCECFHLQIFCNENCNCVDCGNCSPNEGHQKAVIDALTRNPKAFQEEKPQIQNGFKIGVELNQVKKGCKCKKTKCQKKYCECFSSGSVCGIFCKCENCQNH